MSKTVIIATIYDNCNSPNGVEVYLGDEDPLDILEFYAGCKKVYNHYVISTYEDSRLLFSDGTSVELTMQEVQSVKGYFPANRERISSPRD